MKRTCDASAGCAAQTKYRCVQGDVAPSPGESIMERGLWPWRRLVATLVVTVMTAAAVAKILWPIDAGQLYFGVWAARIAMPPNLIRSTHRPGHVPVSVGLDAEHPSTGGAFGVHPRSVGLGVSDLRLCRRFGSLAVDLPWGGECIDCRIGASCARAAVTGGASAPWRKGGGKTGSVPVLWRNVGPCGGLANSGSGNLGRLRG